MSYLQDIDLHHLVLAEPRLTVEETIEMSVRNMIYAGIPISTAQFYVRNEIGTDIVVP